MSNCVLVLSAPRSGSSFITSVIKSLNYSTGKNEAKVKDRFNEGGYFENSSILKFNEKVLRSIGSDICNSCDLSDHQKKLSMDYKEELKGIICEEYPALFVIKDPRIIILRDLYNQVFKHLNISVKTVAIFREAEKSAKSMCDMLSISMPSALACVNYYQNYLRSLKDSESIIKIKLEDIIKSTEELKKITDFLGCKYDKSVDSLFKKSLIHHK